MADTVFHSRSEGISEEGVKDQYADGRAARVWQKFIGNCDERTQNYKDFLIGLLRQHGCRRVLDAACGTGRSEGISEDGVKDQYADGRAARVWQKFIGNCDERTQNYKDFLIGLLRQHGCRRVLDAACGTGVDSMMLVEEGFDVVSVDASDKMLKHALKSRWERRKQPKYDDWVIEEANWVTLHGDVERFQGAGAQFDAVICLGNSFAHLLDAWGDQREQRAAIANFAACLKPGGLLFIDHRNYDAITDTGATPGKSIYYNSKHKVDIKTSVLVVAGKPQLVTLDYCIDGSENDAASERSEFRLAYYPHKLSVFTDMLREAFGARASYKLYADFQPLDAVPNPAFYIHVVQKATD